MLVQDIMTHNVRSVRADTPLLEVSSLMCLYRLSGLPVVEDNNKLAGFIAEKDVLARLLPTLSDFRDGMHIDYTAMELHYRDVIHLKTADLMATRVISVRPDMHAIQAAAVMVRHNFRRIPVAINDTLEGMLSLGDVHKALFHANLARR